MRETDIEKITEKILLENNIPFQKQAPISNIAVVDFLLDGNKIIQCDGDYWHSLPLTRERDKRQEAYFCRHGYRLLRLKGSEIKKMKSQCIERIKAFAGDLIIEVEVRAHNVGRKG
jgi:very-short-patch-repair endonuclease